MLPNPFRTLLICCLTLYALICPARITSYNVCYTKLLRDLDTGAAEGEGGYAREQSEEFLRRQREQMGKAIAEHDVVITTAAVPGKKAPILVTTEMVEGMAPGSVVVDIAAERGGNCEATEPGKTVEVGGVRIRITSYNVCYTKLLRRQS